MKKSPEDYFREQNFSVEAGRPGDFTPAELAFMEKHMGMDRASVLEQLGLPPPPGAEAAETAPPEAAAVPAPPAAAPVPAPPGPAAVVAPPAAMVAPPAAVATPPAPAAVAAPVVKTAGEPAPAPLAAAASAPSGEALATRPGALEEFLKKEPEIQMVGFFIGEQEFTIPTISVQEVIRSMPAAKLPAAPAIVSGVINLRGRVTPLIDLRSVLEVSSPRQGEDKFIIICRNDGLQVGMIIERVHTMYRVAQRDIEWSVEARIGVAADYISGLFKLGEQLVSIVSVERVVAGILN